MKLRGYFANRPVFLAQRGVTSPHFFHVGALIGDLSGERAIHLGRLAGGAFP
jgi:hypothetical protein